MRKLYPFLQRLTRPMYIQASNFIVRRVARDINRVKGRFVPDNINKFQHYLISEVVEP